MESSSLAAILECLFAFGYLCRKLYKRGVSYRPYDVVGLQFLRHISTFKVAGEHGVAMTALYNIYISIYISFHYFIQPQFSSVSEHGLISLCF